MGGRLPNSFLCCIAIQRSLRAIDGMGTSSHTTPKRKADIVAGSGALAGKWPAPECSVVQFSGFDNLKLGSSDKRRRDDSTRLLPNLGGERGAIVERQSISVTDHQRRACRWRFYRIRQRLPIHSADMRRATDDAFQRAPTPFVSQLLP